MPILIASRLLISYQTYDPTAGVYPTFMYDDILEIRDFYKARQGQQVATQLRPKVTDFWVRSEGCCNIAIGFATPFLWQDEVVSVLMPQRHGVLIWPHNQPVRSTLVDPHALPVPDVHTDRLMLVHALEFDSAPGRMLDECWRILDGAGRLLVIVPHRHGIWTRAEKTPFGHGRPYSRRQLRQLLQYHGFEPRVIKTMLFMPPMATGWMLKLSNSIESIGARWWPALGGVLLAEADKMLYAPAGKTSKLRPARPRARTSFAPQASQISQRY